MNYKFFEELERKASKGEASDKECLSLAVHYGFALDLGREEDCMQMLGELLSSETCGLWARYWKAYFHAQEGLIRPEVTKAKVLLQSVETSDTSYEAAKLLLLTFTLEELGEITSDDKILMLKKAVDLQPEWVNTYEYLGEAYGEAGQTQDAIKAYETAFSNLLPSDETIDELDRDYEEIVTGRTSKTARETIPQKLERLKQRLNEQEQ